MQNSTSILKSDIESQKTFQPEIIYQLSNKHEIKGNIKGNICSCKVLKEIITHGTRRMSPIKTLW